MMLSWIGMDLNQQLMPLKKREIHDTETQGGKVREKD